MKAERIIGSYRRLRAQATWGLLAADNGPITIALLQAHLLEGERSLPASIFHDRIGRDLEELRAQGIDLPQTAQAYVAQWLSSGYIERRFPAGAVEEQYELSSSAATAIRFVSSLIEPRTSATESRLAAVIQQLAHLAEETDLDPQTRAAKHLPERRKMMQAWSDYLYRLRSAAAAIPPKSSELVRSRRLKTLAAPQRNA